MNVQINVREVVMGREPARGKHRWKFAGSFWWFWIIIM